MKKIFNWTFGSIFRTLGRIIAYLFVGLLISSILSKTGFKLTDLLPIMKVNAEELVVPVNFVREEHHNIIYENNNSPGFEQSTNNSLISQRLIYSTIDNTINEYHITFDTNNKNYSNITYIEIPFIFSQPLGKEDVKLDSDKLTMTDNKSVYCKEWQVNNDGNYECIIYQNNISSGTLKDHEYLYKEYALNQFSFYIQMVYSDDTWNTCSLNSSSNIVCNVNGKIPKQLYFYINFKTSETTNFLIAISRQFRLYSSATQEQIDSINNINDSIKNDDVSGATDSSSSFFNNFDEGDTGSLMNLVKLPLKFLNSLNNTCSPITFNTGYLGNFTIPCLSTTLYNQEGINPIVNIVSLIINGLIMYGCINTIIKLVHKLKDPNNDEIEVLEL